MSEKAGDAFCCLLRWHELLPQVALQAVLLEELEALGLEVLEAVGAEAPVEVPPMVPQTVPVGQVVRQLLVVQEEDVVQEDDAVALVPAPVS